MKKYPRIYTIFRRDSGGILTDEYNDDMFEYMRCLPWRCTEKVDGTNIRIMFWPSICQVSADINIKSFMVLSGHTSVEFRGRTNKASIPLFLQEKLAQIFLSPERLAKMETLFDSPTCLYGEGFGAGIQKHGANYIPDDVDFALFDVWMQGAGDQTWWLERDSVIKVAKELGITCVPDLGYMTLDDAVTQTKEGFKSHWGDFTAEGIVMMPAVRMLFGNGNPVKAKIRHDDFREGKNVQENSI